MEVYQDMLDGNATTVVPMTTAAPDTDYPVFVGYIAAVVAILFFGSNFIPVKKFETGDGMFFQWVLCAAIWCGGLCTNVITDFPTFYPLAMLGGFLWSTGNLMVVPIIKTIGLGQGILIWGSANMIAGWASGRFGWFGLNPQPVKHSAINFVGIGLCFVSACIFVLIKTETQMRVNEPLPSRTHAPYSSQINEEEEDGSLLPQTNINDNSRVSIEEQEKFFLENLSPFFRRLMGIVLSVISGLLYGLNFTPVIYIKDNYENASQKDIDYVFAHFSGIFATSTLYFVLYCMLKRNQPMVYPRAILPAIASGLMWAIADVGWFVANNVLSEAISFPIVTAGPALIAAMWGVFFGEIRGLKNILVLIGAGTITVTGTVLTGLSK